MKHDFASLNDLVLQPSIRVLRAMTEVMRPTGASSKAQAFGHAPQARSSLHALRAVRSAMDS